MCYLCSHTSYLKEFPFVHLLIAVNIKHFESYMKSCAWLCNSKAPSYGTYVDCVWKLESVNLVSGVVLGEHCWETCHKSGQRQLINCRAPLQCAGVQTLNRSVQTAVLLLQSLLQGLLQNHQQIHSAQQYKVQIMEHLKRLTGQDGQQEQVLCVGYQTCNTQTYILEYFIFIIYI